MSRFSQMVVYVTDSSKTAEGYILEADADFAEEVKVTSDQIGDLNFEAAPPPRCGLLAFEGFIEWHGDQETGEVYMVGGWRELAFDEMCRLRCGEPALGTNALLKPKATADAGS